jgi:sterol desaturase/sphingolipid hydroxylase (fatty acid hydroxylase superfamily)
MTVPGTEALHNERDKTMNPIVYAIPVFMLTILLEAWVARRRGVAVYDIPDAITSLHHGLLSQVTNAFTKIATLGIYIAVYEAYRFTEWSMSSIPLWILALVLYDLCYYWAHRMGHEVNVMWASHVVHHSSEYYNLSTALRQTSTGALFGWVFYLPLAVLGIPWQMLVIVGLIDLLYQYWVHTELIGRLGILDRILVTPSNHRVHHGQNDYCIVFGSMLSTPIINPPQSAILGIHATKDRPVVENGQVVIRPINYLAMSYDHRIIDGREAVLGLVTMKEALEDPARLLLGV